METDRERLLEIKNLHLSFKNDGVQVPALKDVNLHVNKGEMITIVGESGSGKTVTVRSILGLVPTPPAVYGSGEILFEGRDLLQAAAKQWQEIRGREISMVFQDPMTALNPVFTIGQQMENVFLYQSGRNRRNLSLAGKRRRKAEARERSLVLLKKMQLPDPERLLNRYPFELSGGMRQRIVIALALIHTPKLLIADEPGTALDVTVQASINKELLRLVKEENISMIYITHNLGVAKEMGERTYVMRYGEVVEEGRTSEIFASPRHSYTQALLDSVPKLV